MLKTIKFLSIFILILGIGLFLVLSAGVNVEKFSFAGINVSKLYIKLDKKLIVQIENITLPKESETKSSRSDLKRHLKLLPTALMFFQKVDIERLAFKNNEFTIALDDSIFYIDNKFINISAKPFVKGDIVTLDLYSMYLKDYDMLLDGQFIVNLNTDNFTFNGNGYVQGLDSVISAKSDVDFIYFDVASQKSFKNLHFVKNFVRLNTIIEQWMYDNITGDLNLTHLSGKLDRTTFMPILSSLDGSAYITDAKIQFQKGIEPVKAPKINVLFQNDNLSFELIKPKYNETKIDGSGVVIHSLSQTGSNIVINIKTKSRLNQDILDILKSYSIKLPLIQTDGSTQSELAIQIYFNDTDNIITKGRFKAQNSHFKLQNFEFFAHTADVELQNANVLIHDSIVEVDDLTKGKLNLDIDTHASKAKGDFAIERLKIERSGMNLVEQNNSSTRVDVDFSNDTLIRLNDLHTNIAVQKEGVKVNIDSLGTVYPYSQLLKELEIKKGSLYLLIKEENNIDINAKLEELNFPLANPSNGKQIKEIQLSGNIHKGDLKLVSNDQKFKLYLNKKNLDIKLSELDIINKKEKESKENQFLTTITGTHSNILLTPKQKLLGTHYTLVNNQGNTSLDLKHFNTKVQYKASKKGNLTLDVTHASDLFVNTLLGKENLLTDGSVEVHAKGTQNILEGSVYLDATKIKNLALLNNLIIFINTAPGLINPLLALPSVVGMATNSGFNLNGYSVNKGNFDFKYNLEKEQFSFKNLYTNGNMADFSGQGTIDLDKKSIDSEIDIIFLKDYAKIVGYIPVINYIFLGDDKRVATAVQITGDLEDPKVNTNISKEAANVPLDMVKRIFKIPSKGLELFQAPKEEEK